MKGVMWCGDVSRQQVTQMLQLRASLRHTMECAVILTDDPYIQVHIPIRNVENQLSCMVVSQTCQATLDLLHPRQAATRQQLLPPHAGYPSLSGSRTGGVQQTKTGGEGYLLLRTTDDVSNEARLSTDTVACTHREYTLLPFSGCMGHG